jgi:hypothetical protein
LVVGRGDAWGDFMGLFDVTRDTKSMPGSAGGDIHRFAQTILQIERWHTMRDRPALPLCLIPVADLLERGARVRCLAMAISHDPAARRLVNLAEELEAEIARLSRLE